MPAKPTWYGRYDAIREAIATLPEAWLDRRTVERIFEVGPRRAQQLMRPSGPARLGSSLVVRREAFLEYLARVVSGEAAYYEQRRLARLSEAIERWRGERLRTPALLVEAPVSVGRQRFDDLPEGIELGPGRIVVRFGDCDEALQKLLALAMAMGNDLTRFEELTVVEPRYRDQQF